MHFRDWLKRFDKDMNPRGDLARDVLSDKDFPCEKCIKLKKRETMIRRYLEDAGACYGCMAAFEDAWKDYERFVYAKKRGIHL